MTLPDNIAKLGYYSVNGQILFHKYDAIKAASRSGDIVYHFNDESFGRFDWRQDPEPHATLWDLYRRRAQSLRDQFDYLILMYSGGPDSQNMLHSFVDNGIPVDEIVNINSYQQTGVVENTVHNADYVHNVVPTLTELQKLPGFRSRITIVDEIDLMKNHWRYVERKGDASLINVTQGMNMIIVKQTWTRYVHHIWQKILNGENIGIVLGSDKPSVILQNNRYAMVFGDFQSGSGHSYYDDDFKHLDIMQSFYNSAECAPMIIKQGHVLKNFMDANPAPENFAQWAPGERPSHSCPSRRAHGTLKYDIFHQLIYPKWRPGFVTKKPSKIILRTEDNWWMHRVTKEERKIVSHSITQALRDFMHKPDFARTICQGTFDRALTKPYFLE